MHQSTPPPRPRWARPTSSPLREAGLTDRDIRDAVQVISYFNHTNRVADALGTDLEPEMPPRPEGWGNRVDR